MPNWNSIFLGSSLLSPAHGWVGVRTTFLSFCISVPPPSEKTLSGFQQAGKKEGGLGEGIFARLLFLGGGWVCVAFGDAQISQIFVQKRFALRSVIATKQDFPHFWVKRHRFFIGRSRILFSLHPSIRK